MFAERGFADSASHSGLKAQQLLNGQLGTAVEWDEGEGRWKVMMDDGSGKLLRAANLEVLEAGEGPPSPSEAVPSPISHEPGAEAISPGARVRAHGLQAQPQLNGQLGTAVEWDEGEGRWKVKNNIYIYIYIYI